MTTPTSFALIPCIVITPPSPPQPNSQAPRVNAPQSLSNYVQVHINSYFRQRNVMRMDIRRPENHHIPDR